jgi:ribonuclease PH
MRPVTIETGYLKPAEGSALSRWATRVCSARRPLEMASHNFFVARASWVTANYAMLPRATLKRTPRGVEGTAFGADARDSAADRPVA